MQRNQKDSQLTLELECLNSLLSHAQNKRRTAITPGDPQTGDWLWSDESYENWNNSPKPTLLWIQGKPGSGKSTLSKKILGRLLIQHSVTLTELYSSMDRANSSARRLSAKRRERTQPQSADQTTKKSVVIATFFYSVRGAKTEASHVQMLHSLLYQILWQERRLYPLFREKYRELRQTSSGQITGSPWAFEDLWNILMTLAGFDGFPITVYLLIDGMDESERTGERDKMLTLLSDLHSKTSECLVKSVLTSRPDNDIKSILTRLPRIILEDKNRDDIERVIRGKMDTLRQVYYGQEREDSSGSEEEGERMLGVVRKYLADNARGVFLWVELVSKELNDLFKRGITARDLQNTLTNLPDGLEPFYERIVKQLTVENSISTDEAKRMLRWATFALRSLTMEEFRDAIAIPASADEHLRIDREEQRLMRFKDVQLRLQNNCGGLLEIRQKNALRSEVQAQDTVQLLHRTVRDFLLHPGKIADPFDMEESRESCDIALVCIRYLRMSMENAAAVPPVPDWSERSYHDFVQHLSSWPLLPYIMRFLPRHLENSETHLLDAQNFAASFVEDIKCKAGHPALSLLETWLRNLGLPAHNCPDHQAAASFRAKCLDVAASSGNLNVAMVVLDAAGSPEASDAKDGSSFSTTLYNTAIMGHASVLQLLLDKGANVDAKGGDSGGNALQAASFSGNREIVRLLLANGADINARGGKYDNALQAATVGGHPDVIQLLLSTGADINARGGEKYANALQAAALGGRVDIVELLVDSGADVSAHGRSALLAAATSGHLEIVELLLQMGALMIEEDAGEFLDSLLGAASFGGHPDVAQFLLAKRASIVA
ncbi:hypothetical protein BFJ70_g16748 [Fusarium oxysporum]|nr:hypothetical protein BFJ70_g16748 [Fusarium oxysporum]